MHIHENALLQKLHMHICHSQPQQQQQSYTNGMGGNSYNSGGQFYNMGGYNYPGYGPQGGGYYMQGGAAGAGAAGYGSQGYGYQYGYVICNV